MWQQPFVYLCVFSLTCSATGSLSLQDIVIKISLADQRNLQTPYSGCSYPWVLVGRSCVFIDQSTEVSWQDARNFCKERHENGDLATVKDANEFAELLRHVRTILDGNNNFWIGGSDLVHDDEWKWITGEPMPMGSPFWGETEAMEEPVPNNKEHCAFISSGDRYYIHDNACSASLYPICQHRPTIIPPPKRT